VEVGNQNPQQTQQPEGQKRVVDPQSAARVSNHANKRSHEHLFDCKDYAWHRRVSVLLCAAVCLVSGCLANPQRDQAGQLLEQLTHAREQLVAQPPPPPAEACQAVGDVETRLYGEPGLVNVQPAWSQLADAAHALQAVCGQATLLAQPGLDSAALTAAQQRWQQGIQRELGLACDHLRAAATALDRSVAC
jgi:hypothetical protein